MWDYHYKKRPKDAPLSSQKVEAGKGIVGCEMHELHGWGAKQHSSPQPERGLLRALCAWLFRLPVEKEEE